MEWPVSSSQPSRGLGGGVLITTFPLVGGIGGGVYDFIYQVDEVSKILRYCPLLVVVGVSSSSCAERPASGLVGKINDVVVVRVWFCRRARPPPARLLFRSALTASGGGGAAAATSAVLLLHEHPPPPRRAAAMNKPNDVDQLLSSLRPRRLLSTSSQSAAMSFFDCRR